MPMNKMRSRGTPPTRPGPAMCQAPGCDKPAIHNKQYCSMCLALADSNNGTVVPVKKEEPPK